MEGKVADSLIWKTGKEASCDLGVTGLQRRDSQRVH